MSILDRNWQMSFLILICEAFSVLMTFFPPPPTKNPCKICKMKGSNTQNLVIEFLFLFSISNNYTLYTITNWSCDNHMTIPVFLLQPYVPGAPPLDRVKQVLEFQYQGLFVHCIFILDMNKNGSHLLQKTFTKFW